MVLFSACGTDNTYITISTGMGDITVEVYDDKAPATAENFNENCRNGIYDGSGFYRVVNQQNQPLDHIRIDVIQGGLFEDSIIDKYPMIPHETTRQTSIRHLDGTISMARLEPGTASTEFFICVGDQPSLDMGGMRNPDGQGFAAFGRVVRGMEVVREIHALTTEDQYLDNHVLITHTIVRNNL